MKKYWLLFMVILLLTVSIVFNYTQSDKLKASISLSESLEVKLRESDLENDTLELEVSSLAEEMNTIDKQLQNKTDALKLIDDKLEADGEILERIDELIAENIKLKKELNAVVLELKTLEEENSKKIEGVILTTAQIEQWDSDIQDLLELLDARISVLEDGISGLPTLSIERIMVKQEIDFLETIYLDIQQLKKDILDE